jgi:AAA domain-containing protein
MLSDTDLIAMPDPEWLVTDFLVADTLCVLYGQFSTFKSFLALDFALCLATGTPWCGRPVQQCDVLYIAGEGIGGLKRRVSAWKQHHGITTPITGFRVIPLAVNLMDRNEAERLIASVTAADDFKPKFIIVDTLARAMPGGDENSAKDIGVPVRHGGIIQSRLGCALMLVHHAGKDAERGLRGSSGLPGAADTVLRLTRDGHSVTLQVEKQKDHDAEQTLRLRSQVIDLPLLPGSLKSRTSLVLVQDEADAPVRSDRNLTKTERTAKRYLADLIVAEGKPLPPGSGFPSPVKGQNLLGVPIDRWREECETRRLSAADTKNSRGFAFRRTFQGLLDRNAIAARDELVWTA